MKKLLEKTNLEKAAKRPRFAIRYLRGKVMANLGYWLGNGRSFPPGRVFITLTGRCNLKCQMCPQERHASFRQSTLEEREANIAELRTMIDDLSSFRPIIMVSGGELFLHPSWSDVLSHIKKKGLYCSIGTNGTFLEKHASDLVDIGIDELSVSLDGPERIHDEIRGVPGTYAKAVEGIHRVHEAKKRAQTRKPLITIIFTISSLNHRSIATAAETLGSLDIDSLRFAHLNFLRPADLDDHRNLFGELFHGDGDTSWAGYIFEVNDINAELVADAIEGLKNGKNGPVRMTVFPDFSREEILQYYSEGSFSSRSYRNACLAPWDIALIGPKGEVLLCPDYIIGNLRDQNFREIWNNEKARYFRRLILRKKQLPVCSRGCCFFYT